MKRSAPILLTIPVVLLALFSVSGLASASRSAVSKVWLAPLAGAPTVVSYQGQITIGGTAYNDFGDFKFALVNLDGNKTYWSNDGSSTIGDEPVEPVKLYVSNGLFNVLLGDTTLPNMTALPATAFDSTERYLRVWFSSDGTVFRLLTPDRRIAAVPYALQAEEADLLDGQPGSAYQARVSGACAVGSTIRSVNADGTVTCEAHDTRPGFSLTALDGTGTVGTHAAITIGADGLPLISYYDGSNADLKVAHCDDAACSSASLATLDGGGMVGEYTSIVIGADGLGLISYFDQTNGNLKVAHCNDIACSGATIATVDNSSEVVGGYNSITVGADGLGLISYYDGSNYDLKLAHCNDVACSSATLGNLDWTNIVGQHTSITIGADGLPLISYFDQTNSALKVAHCDNVACSSLTKVILDNTGEVGRHTSVMIGADGLPLISYRDDTTTSLKVAHCNNAACSTATFATLDNTGNVGEFTSVAIGADGLPLISYFDFTNDALKVAHCSNVNCSSATLVTVDNGGLVGLYTSITIGADGLPLISYYDNTNYDLKVAHCSNPFCVPYFRRP
jgi:preprotein translocase subunit Sec61beta